MSTGALQVHRALASVGNLEDVARLHAIQQARIDDGPGDVLIVGRLVDDHVPGSVHALDRYRGLDLLEYFARSRRIAGRRGRSGIDRRARLCAGCIPTMTDSMRRTVILSPVRSSSNSFTSGATVIICVVLEPVRTVKVRVDRSTRSTVPDTVTDSRLLDRGSCHRAGSAKGDAARSETMTRFTMGT